MRETRERLESSGREAQVALRAELDSAHQAEVDKLQTKLNAEITQLKTVLQEKEVEIQVHVAGSCNAEKCFVVLAVT